MVHLVGGAAFIVAVEYYILITLDNWILLIFLLLATFYNLFIYFWHMISFFLIYIF
jgi:hypothetical protein